ncbi:hypothetical protein ACPC54_23500 [Kitasatospora sp. NPDC094028]
MPESPDGDSEFTELVDANIPRVDLVNGPANGAPGWLLMKQDANSGLMDPAFVRELISKSADDDPPSTQEQVSVSGSPAAIAKMIHQAAARATAAESEVSKAMDSDEIDVLDPSVVLAEPDCDAPGDENTPGSPAWEAIDAATAQKWTSIAVRLKNALGVMADRELLEAASADPDDAEAAWDLQDAQCALDYVIDTLAGFAVDEQAEAELGSEAMAAVGKVLHGVNPAALDTVEALGHVAKAGRVLSAANEAAIRTAAHHLQKVLASLPAAPEVAKTAHEEPTMPTPTPSEDVTTASGQEPAMGTAGVEKATDTAAVDPVGKADSEKTPLVVVYDQKGRLIGIVDPGDITPVANAEADADDLDASPNDSDSGAAESSDASDASDLTPAPAAEVGTPADAVPDDDDQAVTKSQTDTDTTSGQVLKSNAPDTDAAAVDQQNAAHEVIAKQAKALKDLAGVVDALKAQVQALEEQPAQPRVFTNGVQPPTDLRGMDRGGFQADVIKAQARRRDLYRTANATEQNRLAQEMQGEAIAALQAIQRQ